MSIPTSDLSGWSRRQGKERDQNGAGKKRRKKGRGAAAFPRVGGALVRILPFSPDGLIAGDGGRPATPLISADERA